MDTTNVKIVPIRGYEGYYTISEDGEIFTVGRSVTARVNGWIRTHHYPSMKRKLSEHGTGYLTVRLSVGGVVKTHRVHRLVASSFIPNPDNKPFVNHKDGDKKNNKVSNLEWVTEKENTTHAIVCGLKPDNLRCGITGRYLVSNKN